MFLGSINHRRGVAEDLGTARDILPPFSKNVGRLKCVLPK
jgi:hypothetical protein